MRRAALLGAAAALALGTGVAKADVFVDGEVNKYVNIDIREWVDIDKDVDIDVRIRVEGTEAAETEAVFNQKLQGNHACENCAEKVDLITGSVLGNIGITSVNQATGNMNNQGTVISIAFYDATDKFQHVKGIDGKDPNGHYALADSQVVGEQKLAHNTVYSEFILYRDARIEGSINENMGITAVNQSVGNINNQANTVSIAVTAGLGVALSDVALGQYNANNTTVEYNTQKRAITVNSVNQNQGITQVNQAAGVNANQANVVSVSAAGLN